MRPRLALWDPVVAAARLLEAIVGERDRLVAIVRAGLSGLPSAGGGQ